MGAILDDAGLRRWCVRAAAALHARRAEIDALNVFPVPDADTGTNLALTLGCALQGCDGPGPFAVLARRVVLEARGSSGAIFAQFLAGVGQAAVGDGRRGVDGAGLAAALQSGAAWARAAVAHPVEGTMLTVLDEAARGAAEAASSDGDPSLVDVADAAVAAARAALERTPRLLPVLAEAGVVDAGGLGAVVVLEALADEAHGRDLPELPDGRVEPPPAASEEGDRLSGTFEVMYTISPRDDGSRAVLSGELTRLGRDVVVAGVDDVWQVHLHTTDPDGAVAVGGRYGAVSRIRTTPLREGGCTNR
ncbi:MAG: DAK2 domain-containing protein [Acidothermus sp.]|nr:DAK2 domain-containing protein [Acidothermus sp.]